MVRGQAELTDGQRAAVLGWARDYVTKGAIRSNSDWDISRYICDLQVALEAQGLLQKRLSGSFVWHAYDCPAAFDFAECNARCRIARPMIREEWRWPRELFS